MEKYEFIDVEKNLLLKFPFTMTVAGSTGSGKTVLVRELLNHFDKITTYDKPASVIWCYGIHQELYRKPLGTDSVRVTYCEGFPDSVEGYDVVVLDDLQSTAGDDKRLADLFTRYSHHKKTSVIYVVQNLFLQSKHMRTVALNSHYLILMSSRRDRNQVARLATQLFPGDTTYFMASYKKALSRDFGYLLCDLSPTTEERNRLRSHILPLEYPIRIYRGNGGF